MEVKINYKKLCQAIKRASSSTGNDLLERVSMKFFEQNYFIEFCSTNGNCLNLTRVSFLGDMTDCPKQLFFNPQKLLDGLKEIKKQKPDYLTVTFEQNKLYFRYNNSTIEVDTSDNTYPKYEDLIENYNAVDYKKLGYGDTRVCLTRKFLKNILTNMDSELVILKLSDNSMKPISIVSYPSDEEYALLMPVQCRDLQ